MAPPPEEDQVKGTPMDEDAGEAEAEAKEVEVNVLADEGSQHPDDGASQLLDNEASQDDHEHAQNMKFKKTGNLSHAALDEIHDFTTEVKAKAEELGHQHGKSPCDILVTAGLSVKPSHTKLNEVGPISSTHGIGPPN
ncbi:hypothetical protein BKA82DRAFT_25729 [Pisolithus tinctorius]|uniref:Uncharacterized protein n=1 Tax=Pisolithus tinctorius Marx 270 TaxID=870435 RepID=A0A0C3PAZ2_PISTI|nr:hypothetical protein BKA82DRAFT_25729 [Pisolithus tinctorius]KIO05106.1 hypothetical protein M404DRAFT_25729 [Pisolithus tinctorius Marx 270]